MSEQPQQRQPTAAEAAILAAVEQQRQQQLLLGAEAMAALIAIWPSFARSLSSGQLARWFAEVLRLTTAYGEAGWEMSRRGYMNLRNLSGADGIRPALRPIPVNRYRLWLDIRDHVVKPYTDGLAAGLDPRVVDSKAKARAAGDVQKHALEPGRKLVTDAVDKAAFERGADLPEGVEPPRSGEVDRQLIGWVRTTDGDPCYFCAMLASRGAVYASLQSAEFRADGTKFHPSCGCVAYPVWSDNPTLPEINYELAALWREAQANPPPGEREQLTTDSAGRTARNNYRRLLAQRSRDMARQQGAPDFGP